MRRGPVLLLALAALSGCSFEMPSFLGREGSQSGTYSFGDDAPEGAYDPVAVPVSSAVAERALHGVILRADSIAPTQGYYAAALETGADLEPDASGTLTVRLTALAPTTPQATGAPRTRTLTAALFVQNVALRDVRAFRVVGAPNTVTVPLPR